MEKTRKIDAVTLTKLAMCTALLCVSAFISFPLPFTPIVITAQTIILNLIALILTPKQSLIVVGVYILLGICGLPVFAGGTAGFGRLFGPTGGFIIGFLAVAPLISLLKGKNNSFFRYLLVTVCVGMPVLYAFGTVVMCIVTKNTIGGALMAAVVPFILGDVLKCLLAAYLAKILNKVLAKKFAKKPVKLQTEKQ
ncbi:MAG: biotin transporter BioY [Oscillospiraceae bacterium]